MFFLVVSGLVVSVAGWIDARSGQIPNRLTFPALVAGIAARGVLDGGRGLALALLGVVAVALVPCVLFASSRGRGIGGGDVKLFAVLGAWLGPALGVEAQFLSFVFLLSGVLVALTWRGRLLTVLAGFAELSLCRVWPKRWIRRVPSGRWRRSALGEASTPVRMGPAIALGTLVVCLLESAGRQWPS